MLGASWARGVVDDDVHVEAGGHGLVDEVQDPAELLSPVASGEVAALPEATARAA